MMLFKHVVSYLGKLQRNVKDDAPIASNDSRIGTERTYKNLAL